MVKIPTTLRPGVFTSVTVRAAFAGSGGGRGVAAVGRAAAGTAGVAAPVETLAQAAVFGEDSVLYGMVKILLEAAVSPVYAVAAGEDYAAALEATAPLAEVCAIVCDGGGETLGAQITANRRDGRGQIGVLAIPDAAAACAAAKALNHAQMVIVCDGGSKTAVGAAGFAAIVAKQGAQGSFSGAELPPFAGFDGALTAEQVETLLEAGVTPLERVGDRVECIRAMTTATKPDRTLTGLSAVLAVDEITDTIRRAIKTRLTGLRNNAATRESIASQIMVELEGKRALGVIDSYLPPSVTAHPNDPGVCVATLAIKTAPEINQIVISAEIQV